jgi:hypothetical protein
MELNTSPPKPVCASHPECIQKVEIGLIVCFSSIRLRILYLQLDYEENLPIHFEKGQLAQNVSKTVEGCKYN